jgi:hypothetical protein
MTSVAAAVAATDPMTGVVQGSRLTGAGTGERQRCRSGTLEAVAQGIASSSHTGNAHAAALQ